MTGIDLLITAVILISIISAFIQGFLVELFSLAGLFLGLSIAAADYARLAPWVARWVENSQAANLIAFLLIGLAVMLAAGIAGRILRGTVRHVGLGFVDRLLGAFFGLIKGGVIVTLGIMAIAAFFPNADWLKDSKLAPMFLPAAHDVSRITPSELGEKIREGLRLLRGATAI